MQLNEELIQAWIGMTSLFKNNRMTKGLTYNESVVLLFAYNYYESEKSPIPLQMILKRTLMKKSLLNRTVDSLISKGLIIKKKGEHDSRTLSIQINPDQSDVFLAVHKETLSLMNQIIEVVGEEDAMAFIRIYEKLQNTDIFTK